MRLEISYSTTTGLYALALLGPEFVDYWSGPYKTLRAAKIALTYWRKHPERWQDAW